LKERWHIEEIPNILYGGRKIYNVISNDTKEEIASERFLVEARHIVTLHNKWLEEVE